LARADIETAASELLDQISIEKIRGVHLERGAEAQSVDIEGEDRQD
jgi:hypothetical protein